MDLLLKRYKDTNYIFHLNLTDGLDLVKCAVNQDEEDRLFLLYAQKFAYMNEKTYVPFERFFSAPQVDDDHKRKRTKEEILEIATQINRKLNERRKN